VPGLDARALALLDQLLDLTEAERQPRLAALAAQDPALHARLQRLLHAAGDDAASRAIAGPLAAALQASAPRPQPGECIAGYRLLRLLGEGGMATVWLAERAEGGLKREVALKLPLVPLLSGVLAERFARERDVLAALDHPHIARLFDAGVTADGQPYIVLEAVAGQPITAHAEANRLSARQRLALFLQVLAAVEHAHGRMVVHRDLKPGNILVSDRGQVKLLDFGIAKLLQGPDQSALTQDAAAVMTPRYAAPEQVLGQPVTAATDIYAAGVVLYELLVGALPYAPGPGSALSLMQAVVQQPPRPPGLSRDIDTVLLKALAKLPEQRYASVERFAEDLRRLLDGRPILARRVPAWQRAGLLARRRPAATAGVLAAGLALAAVAGLAWQKASESAAQRLRGDAVREFIYRMVAEAEPAEGHTEVSGVEMIDAAVSSARRDVADPRLRGELLGALGRTYLRLRQNSQARAVLAEALALLEAHAPPADAARNQALAGLARTWQDKEPARAMALARQALAACTQAGAECAKARAEAALVLSASEGWLGRDQESLRHGRNFLRETGLAYGEQSLEMASALEFFTGAARNSGRLQEAADAIARARAIAEHRTMRATSRVRLDLVQATMDADLGHLDTARQRLQQLLQQPAPWYERAAQWRVLASVETALDHFDEAVAAADAALQALPADWALTAQAGYAHQLRGTALSKAGRHDDALAALAQARQDLAAAGYADAAPAMARLRRHEAEAQLRAGQPRPAATALAALAQLPTAQPVEAGLVAWALGCAQQQSGDRESARVRFEAGTHALAAALPADHPLLLRGAQLQQARDCRKLL
jgi:serine/threonine-protein kinase